MRRKRAPSQLTHGSSCCRWQWDLILSASVRTPVALVNDHRFCSSVQLKGGRELHVGSGCFLLDYRGKELTPTQFSWPEHSWNYFVVFIYKGLHDWAVYRPECWLAVGPNAAWSWRLCLSALFNSKEKMMLKSSTFKRNYSKRDELHRMELRLSVTHLPQVQFELCCHHVHHLQRSTCSHSPPSPCVMFRI